MMDDDTVDELPVVDASEIDVPRDCNRPGARVDGVVLAAGRSSRFGDENKLLAPVDGEPMVRHALEALLESRIDRTLVVVGYQAERIRSALDGLDVIVVENDAYENGQATSIRAAIAAIRDRGERDAAVFALGDMPFVGPETVDALLEAYAAGVGGALAVAHDGQRGNPVLFDSRYFDRLADVTGDTGGRDVLLGASDGALVEVDDPSVSIDIDTPEALDRLTGGET